MAIDEASRHELHEAVRQVFGPSAGDTLTTLLPPVGWADVARQRDVDAGFVAMRSDLEAGLAAARRDLDVGLAALRRDLELQLLELRTSMIDEIRSAEHRIRMWMFTTVLAGIAISTAVATAVALAV